jgi:hypothetical protein
MPAGYRFVTHAAEFARFALGKARWAVLALCCHAGHATLAHYRASVVADGTLSGLFKDVFYFRWKEASQHAVVDEIEWRRADARLAPAERDRAVDDLAGLVRAIGRSLELQAGDDAAYVAEHAGRPLRGGERQDLADLFLGAYRWQHLGCGFAEPGFAATLRSLLDPAQLARIDAALPARGD